MSGPFVPRTEGWDRVSLAELNRRAPLLDRAERKYLASSALIDQVMGELRHSFDVLAIDGQTVFTYDTVYYDTDCLLAYRDQVQGKRRRLKIRSRHYVESDLYFFEVKLKGARGRTIKERMPAAGDPTFTGPRGSPPLGQGFHLARPGPLPLPEILL